MKGEVKKKEVYVYTTAFAVRNDGILLTSAHVFNFNNLSNCSFEVRKLDSNHDVKSASISDMYSYWDLCLLKVDNVVGCECVTLASDGSLRQGDNLFCIANPDMCVGSFGLAHVSYACVEDVNIPTGANACSQHVSNVNNETPPYLVMGHFWNRSYLTSNKAPSNNWKRRLHAMIPVVHSGNICEGMFGAAGAPVFNIKGEVVGMLLTCDDEDDQLAIHVTLIREYLKRLS